MNKIKKLGVFGLLIAVSVAFLGLYIFLGRHKGVATSGPYAGEDWFWIGFLFIVLPAVIFINYVLYSLFIFGKTVSDRGNKGKWHKVAIQCFVVGFVLIAAFGLVGGPNSGLVLTPGGNHYFQAQTGVALLLVGIISSRVSRST